MARLGPFESRPHLAVAVSGGADSLALALLADAWARSQHGTVTALTVDHGLREGSASEAAQVRAWLAARGLAHVTLRWAGAKPDTGRQAAAREARYRLMSQWCRDNGVLHLMLAHHRDDQAETFLLRFGRASRPEGLAAMAAVAERPDLRLLRPLLDISGTELETLLNTEGQPWIEDPSNRDPAYARSRVRGFTRRLAQHGLSPEALGEAARERGRERREVDAAIARVLAAGATVDPAGFAWLDPGAIGADDLRPALARVVMTVGGRTHPPRGARLDRLAAEIAARLAEGITAGGPGKGRTLAGCRIVPRRDRLLICREPAAAREVLELGAPGRYRWDGRYVFTLRRERGASGLAEIARLGRDGWARVLAERPELKDLGPPSPARAALPAIRVGGDIAAVPHLNYRAANDCGWSVERVDFAPTRPLAGPRFGVV